MWIDKQIKQYRALDKWFNSPLGVFVAKEFSDLLHSFEDYLYGDSVLQLGCFGDNSWLKALQFKKIWIASPYVVGDKVQLNCSFSQIPVGRNSLDCVIAPLTFEPFINHSSLIDEIDRILKPMGFVVLLSMNPWSLWGGAMKCGWLPCFKEPIKMRTPFSINRTFVQRGYRQCDLSNFCYIPPVKNEAWIKKLTFLEEVGKMLWPFPSGFYCYVAQKHEYISPSLIKKCVETPILVEVPQSF